MNQVVKLLIEFIDGAERAAEIGGRTAEVLREYAPKWWEDHVADLLIKEREAKAEILAEWKDDYEARKTNSDPGSGV